MKKNFYKNSFIILSFASIGACSLWANFSFAGQSITPTGQLNLRVTRENFEDYSSSLVINDEKQIIKPNQLFFENFNLLTNNMEYKDIFSVKNPKFQPNVLKTLREKQPETASNDENNSPEVYNVSFSKQYNQPTAVSFSSIDQFSNNAGLYSMIESDNKASAVSEPEKYYNLALNFYKNNNYDEAEKAFLKVTELKPDFYYAFYNLGNLYYKKEDYYKALDYFNKAMDLNPSNPDVYYNVAATLELLNNKTLAKKFYAKCFELNPSDKQAQAAAERLEESN